MNKNKLKTALLILPFILLVIGVAQFAWHGDEGLYGSPKNPIYGTWNATISDSQGKEVYVEMVYNDDNSCIFREYDDQRKHHKDLDTGRFELESGKISIWCLPLRSVATSSISMVTTRRSGKRRNNCITGLYPL